MIIALILASFVFGFITGILVFRNNVDKIKETEDKVNSVIDDIKK